MAYVYWDRVDIVLGALAGAGIIAYAAYKIHKRLHGLYFEPTCLEDDSKAMYDSLKETAEKE
jgi:hypothetical protein